VSTELVAVQGFRRSVLRASGLASCLVNTAVVIRQSWGSSRQNRTFSPSRRLGLHCRLSIAEIFLNSVNTRMTFLKHILGNRQENVVNSS